MNFLDYLMIPAMSVHKDKIVVDKWLLQQQVIRVKTKKFGYKCCGMAQEILTALEMCQNKMSDWV